MEKSILKASQSNFLTKDDECQRHDKIAAEMIVRVKDTMNVVLWFEDIAG